MYIKPNVSKGSASNYDVPASGNAGTNQLVKGDDTRLTDSRSASDVFSWAKEATKPSYAYSEITGTPSLGSASEKDYTTYISPNNLNVPTSGSVYNAISSATYGAFHPAGSKTCAELTSSLLIQANVGNVYKITDSGTTDSNWIGGAGQTINANDMAVVVYGGESNTFKFNLENGINLDLSAYQTKALSNPIVVDGVQKTNVEDTLTAINIVLSNLLESVSGISIVDD